MTEFQPTLPAIEPFTEAELNYADEEPPQLFPDNQNSNWGLLRKIFSDRMQEVIDQIGLLYEEKFVETSSRFLDKWEYEVGLPTATNDANDVRRAKILGRIRRDLFTRQRREEIIESFIVVTFGPAVQLTGAGVPLVSAGVPLYSGLTSSVGLYTITENIENFSYEVTVDPSANIDTVALTRELARVTPGGINFSVVVGSVVPPTTGTYGTGTYGAGTYGG